jgi:molybdopterin-guanine dinucleotide biosynthesis protein A
LLETIIERVSAVAQDVAVVAPPDRGYDQFGVRCLADAVPERGPLGGIATALATARFDRCLILSCDLPCLRPEVLSWMAGQPFPGDALVPLIPVGPVGRLMPQPLHAIYKRRCESAVSKRLDRGQLRVAAMLDDLDVSWLTADEIRVIDPDLRSFFNLNEPADVAHVIGVGDSWVDARGAPRSECGR